MSDFADLCGIPPVNVAGSDAEHDAAVKTVLRSAKRLRATPAEIEQVCDVLGLDALGTLVREHRAEREAMT